MMMMTVGGTWQGYLIPAPPPAPCHPERVYITAESAIIVTFGGDLLLFLALKIVSYLQSTARLFSRYIFIRRMNVVEYLKFGELAEVYPGTLILYKHLIQLYVPIDCSIDQPMLPC